MAFPPSAHPSSGQPWEILAPPPVEAVSELSSPPSFSVVIAAYQVADMIPDAIHSVLDQSQPAQEVIVVNDGSADDLEGAVRPFGSRITLLHRDHLGAAAAMNAGAFAAQGDFVCFIGADDIFDRRRLEALGHLAMIRPDLDVLTTDSWVSLGGRVFRRFNDPTFPFEIDNQRRTLLERNFVFGHTAVRRERFLQEGGFDESIRWTSDWELWARMVLNGSVIGSVNEPLATYRLHEGALSSKRLNQAHGRLTTSRRILEHPSLTPEERRYVEALIETIRREIAWREASEALQDKTPDARARCLMVLRDGGQTVRVRAEALLGAAAPKLAAGALRRRRKRFWVGAGGVRVRRR